MTWNFCHNLVTEQKDDKDKDNDKDKDSDKEIQRLSQWESANGGDGLDLGLDLFFSFFCKNSHSRRWNRR